MADTPNDLRGMVVDAEALWGWLEDEIRYHKAGDSRNQSASDNSVRYGAVIAHKDSLHQVLKLARPERASTSGEFNCYLCKDTGVVYNACDQGHYGSTHKCGCQAVSTDTEPAPCNGGNSE